MIATEFPQHTEDNPSAYTRGYNARMKGEAKNVPADVDPWDRQDWFDGYTDANALLTHQESFA
jgi:ribosome modulation factor